MGVFRQAERLLETLSSKPITRNLVYSSSLLFFCIIVLLPPILGILLKWQSFGQIFQTPALLTRASSAISWSFAIAFMVSILDLLAAIPLAWLIVRRKSRWTKIIDSLADVPFIIPTVALGLSMLLFWSRREGVSGLLGIDGLVSPGLTLILLLHFAFSFPVVVRVMVGELQGYEERFEIVARTLGASPLTAIRTVTLPILKPAIIASFLLAFARSLSETGATIVVAGAFENGPVFIKNVLDAELESPLVFVSSVLIFSSVVVFMLIRFLGGRLGVPTGRVWPNTERWLGGQAFRNIRDVTVLSIFLFFVILPSLFSSLPAFTALFDGTLESALNGRGIWSQFWQSMLLSYIIGILATLINMLTGLPIAVLIARRKLGRSASTALNALVDIPIVVPSVALGVSLSFYWGSFAQLPEFWVLVLAHTTISYTYFVRAMVAALEGIPIELEDVSRTLGASPFTVFRRVISPLAKYSLFAGAVLVFTRSVDETGAALAVSRQMKTAPVLLVDWLKGVVSASPSEQGLGIAFLVLTSFSALLLLRFITGRGERRTA